MAAVPSVVSADADGWEDDGDDWGSLEVQTMYFMRLVLVILLVYLMLCI